MLRRLCTIAVVCFGLLGAFSAFAQDLPTVSDAPSSAAEFGPDTPLSRSTWDKPYLEWATLGLGGGTHGFATEAQFFGFRMPQLTVTIVDMMFSFGAPGRWEDPEYDYRPFKVFLSWGTTIAYPLVLDSAGRHELRFGITPEYHLATHGHYDLPGDCPSGESFCSPGHTQGMAGFAIAPRIDYQYRMTEVVALRMALSTHISIAGGGFCGLFCESVEQEYPWPGVFFTIGFRFGTPWIGKN